MSDSLKKILTKMKPETARELDETLGDTFFETVSLALIDELPESDMVPLEAVLKSGDAEALEKFLRARIPDMDRIIVEAIAPSASMLQIVNEKSGR
jgi:hypothetical protein